MTVFGLEGSPTDKAVAVPLEEGLRGIVMVRRGRNRIQVVRDGHRAAAWFMSGGNLNWTENKGPAVLFARSRGRPSRGRWDPWTGRSLVKGVDDLTPVPGVITYWYTWAAFHPKSQLADAARYKRGRSVSHGAQSRPGTR